MRHIFRVSLCFMTVAAFGCLGGGGGGGGSSDGGVNPIFPGGNGNSPFGENGSGNPQVDQLFVELNRAWCGLMDRCLPGFTQYTIGSDCAGTMALRMVQTSGQVAANSVAGGRMEIDQAELTACINAIQNTQCNGLATLDQDPFSKCDQVAVGQVDIGGDCAAQGECAGDAFCHVFDQCPGTCTPRRDVGDECFDDEECQAPARCFGQCTLPKQEGEMCEFDECDDGLECEDGTCISNMIDITVTAGNGQMCNPFEGRLCGPNLYCAFSQTGLTCKPIGNEGQVCSPGLLTPCTYGLYCAGLNQEDPTVQGVCTALPAEGEACLDEDAFQRCALPNVCAAARQPVEGEAQGVCVMPQVNGTDCTSSEACLSSMCEDGVCRAEMPACTLESPDEQEETSEMDPVTEEDPTMADPTEDDPSDEPPG